MINNNYTSEVIEQFVEFSIRILWSKDIRTNKKVMINNNYASEVIEQFVEFSIMFLRSKILEIIKKS